MLPGWMRHIAALVLMCQVFVACQNFYDSDPHIIEANARNFDKIVHGTNYTSLVEFYAPWCGYCKQLKPVMHRAGKKLDGVAQVVTVNCDQEANKRLCSEHGVEGFPTLMVFRPAKTYRKGQKNAQEKYQGQRTLKPIVDFVKSRIKNTVKKLRSVSTVQNMLVKQANTNLNNYVMVFFSSVDVTPAQYKAVGINWSDMVDLFFMHNRKLGKSDSEEDRSSAEKFKSAYPTMADSLQKIVDAHRENSDLNRLVLLDKTNDKVHTYQGKSMTGSEIAQFINGITGLTPREGPLSNRHDYLAALKSGKKPKKASKKKAQKPVRDEL
ncbi:protein disulfide isomerase [Maudiozyma humilis]|uniref:Protein disulfide isomerase n=1 Tax=Maudiozyma humilis TaxID=51915 RepID=A0AAV5S6J7_MAUHU|nr:protein disulfide isomerase [Kazachstania humilis]